MRHVYQAYLRLLTGEGIATFIKSNHRYLERGVIDVVYAFSKNFLNCCLDYHITASCILSSSMNVRHFRACNRPEGRKCYDNPDLCYVSISLEPLENFKKTALGRGESYLL
jgi:hypothetical protein